jgi:hypothetical protein
MAKTDLTDILDEATLVAALTCGRQGADPPTALKVRRHPASG